MRLLRFRHDEQSGRLFVEAVNDSGAVVVIPRELGLSPHESIHQRPAPIPRRGMDNHSRRLVHHEQRVVLIDDLQRNILAEQLAL